MRCLAAFISRLGVSGECHTVLSGGGYNPNQKLILPLITAQVPFVYSLIRVFLYDFVLRFLARALSGVVVSKPLIDAVTL
jgi:hypothetical protein